MRMKVVFVLLDKFADWEFAPLASALNALPDWNVQTVSPQAKAVRSLGGLTVIPDAAVEDISCGGCEGIANCRRSGVRRRRGKVAQAFHARCVSRSGGSVLVVFQNFVKVERAICRWNNRAIFRA